MISILLILAIVGSATSDFSNLAYRLYGCNPPRTLRGKIELEAFDSDRNNDGVIDNSDFERDIIDYDYDGDVSRVMEWEAIFYFGCVYGYEKDYAVFVMDSIDINKDRVITMSDDFIGPFYRTGAEFRQLLLQRFRVYCEQKNNKARDCYRLKYERNLNNFGNYSLPYLQTKGK